MALCNCDGSRCVYHLAWCEDRGVTCTSSMRRRYASSFLRLRFFLSDSQAGTDLPPETVYTCAC